MTDDGKALAYLKKAAAELYETRKRLEDLEGRLDEPIAIVGMGCRLPGGVRCPRDLWQLLVEERDAISEFPEDRGWDLEELRAEEVVPKGGFIEGIAEFDASFFGVDEEEARLMDPQQRLLLEVSWETLENAGIDPTGLGGSRSGVFVGVSAQHYANLVIEARADGVVQVDHIVTGNSGSMVSGRVAHVLGLEGPAVSVDAACASSTVALHLACQALRAGDCTMAIAGGVSVLVTPLLHIQFAKQQLFAIAKDARCKSFSDAADGVGVGEGVALVLLERLSDARRNGHEVLAVIRGSAVNQDGASNGLTAPNGKSHESVAIEALRNAGMPASRVDAIEAHGMGTPLGDSIEAQAMVAVYGERRESERRVGLGSVKSNLGHTLAAGGVAGVIKMVLGMQNGVLPKTLHIDQPTRFVDWGGGAVSPLTESELWPDTGHPRCAAVHSFGMSGTNAHVILEEAPARERDVLTGADPQRALGVGTLVPWLVSGRGADGFERQARRLLDFAATSADRDVDVGWSLATARPFHGHRGMVVGESREELESALSDLIDSSPSSIDGVVESDRLRVVFCFSPAGNARSGVAAPLRDSCPFFAAELGRCYEDLAERLGCSVEEAESKTGATPAFAQAVVLAKLWRTCGVEPSAVVASGEGVLAGALVAGATTLEDAVEALLGSDREFRWSSGQIPFCPLGSTRKGGEESDPGDQFDKEVTEVAAELSEGGIPLFLEVGFEGELATSLGERVRPQSPASLGVSLGGQKAGDLREVLLCLGRLWTVGVRVDWASVFAGSGARPADLPTYAFERSRHWIGGQAGSGSASGGGVNAR